MCKEQEHRVQENNDIMHKCVNCYVIQPSLPHWNVVVLTQNHM